MRESALVIDEYTADLGNATDPEHRSGRSDKGFFGDHSHEVSSRIAGAATGENAPSVPMRPSGAVPLMVIW